MIKRSGFTLVEVLVSLFILSIAITGAFALIAYHLNVADSVKNSAVASGLAQEGMEVVRNLRDSDWFAGRQFGSLGGGSVASTYCVQWNSTRLISPCTNPLKKGANGIYSYDGDLAPSIFLRTVTITRIPATEPVELKVVVTVSWTDRSIPRSLSAEGHLFNWY